MASLSESLKEGVNKVQENVGLPDNLRTVAGALGVIIQVVLASAGVLFVLMFVFGGITYLTGAGNEEVTGKAKRMMVDASIGLVVTVGAWAIATYILTKFGFATP